MGYDVFISYAGEDRDAADAVCHHLEAADLRCWIAPRDISPGSEWDEGIQEGLDQSRVVVLVYSADADASQYVKREVIYASDRKCPIIPLRLTETSPRQLKLLLSASQWLDAFPGPVDRHLPRLAGAVQRILGNGSSTEPRQPGRQSVAPRSPAPAAVGAAPAVTSNHSVFVVASTADQETAEQVRAHLTSAGIPAATAAQIEGDGDGVDKAIRGIEAAGAVVLLFSSRTDASKAVRRAIAFATEDCEKPVVSFKIADAEPNNLRPLLEAATWVDGRAEPLRRMPALSAAVRECLGLPAERPAAPAARPVPGASGKPPGTGAGARIGTGVSPPVGGHGRPDEAQAPAGAGAAVKVALAYKRGRKDDEHVMRLLEDRLSAAGYEVFVDRHMAIGVPWGGELDHQIRCSDALVVLLSEASIHSEMVEYEVALADQTRQETGKPRIMPVRVDFEGDLPDPLRGIVGPLQYFPWTGEDDDDRLVKDLAAALRAPPRAQPAPPGRLEAVGGAVPLDAEFYVERATDGEFYGALDRHDAIVLIKGARQMGKTSLLARGIQRARAAGTRVAVTDLQKFSLEQMKTPESFLVALGEFLADPLDLDVSPQDSWKPNKSPYVNFEKFVRREVLQKLNGPLVWGIDEADRLLTCGFGSEVFAQFRTWYNERAFDPECVWWQLTLAIAYATEPHLFITDPNQSPFNVGTRLELQDFTRDQVADLNRRYKFPLAEGAELSRFHRLVGGQPFLVRRGLNEMAARPITLTDLEAQADQENGPYGDHLRRILVMLAKDARQCDVVRGLLRGEGCPDPDSFYRLRGLGVVAGNSAHDCQFRCRLYESYLRRHLL